MARPRKPRQCGCPDRAAFKAVYKPVGVSLADLDKLELYHDELEALHLCDGEGLTQVEAGGCMGVSRGTVQRLLAEARRKIAFALVSQVALVITSRGLHMADN